VADLVQCDEVAHLAPHRRDADLEPSLGAAVTVPDADDHGAAAARRAPDPITGAEVVDVEVKRPCVHESDRSDRPGRNNERVIALTSGIALLIGWYRGFTLRSLELAAAAFVVVLAVQTIGLVVTSREQSGHYWITVALVGAGWIVCVWLGSRARTLVRR
jgi:hypothetical protein